MHLKSFRCQNLLANNNLLCATLGNLLESGMSKLETLSLRNCNVASAGCVAIAQGLRSIKSSLTVLDMSINSIGSEGLTALAAALANSTSIQDLNLDENEFSTAAVGLRCLSEWLHILAIKLDVLHIRSCGINDEGLQALTAGVVNNCKVIDLSENNFTTFGLKHLSTSLQSESCCLESLYLGNMDTGDDGAKVLARGLVGNKLLEEMFIQSSLVDKEEESHSFPPGWFSAFSSVLCNTSTVNNTYLSNHTILALWDEDLGDVDDFDEDVSLYLQLNKNYPEHAARCKIFMNRTHLNMAPLFQWELKFLPLAVDWFERSKPFTTLSIPIINEYEDKTIFEESDAEFQSRVLTALYEFVRGVRKKVLERRNELILMEAYDDKIAVVKHGNKRLHEDVEQRDRKITQLEKENKRLKGIIKSVRNALDS